LEYNADSLGDAVTHNKRRHYDSEEKDQYKEETRRKKESHLCGKNDQGQDYERANP